MTESAQFYVPAAPAPAEGGDSGGAANTSTTTQTLPRDFRELARNLSPRFLSFPVGERLMGFLGLLFDALAQGAQLATQSRYLFSPQFASDALKLIGSERMLPRYLREGLGAYHTRLHDAWNIWRRAGGEAQILEQLQLAVGATFTRESWAADFDDDPANWSRVWLVSYLGDHPWRDEGTWGDGQVWGDGGTWGSTASVAEVEMMRTLVALFKPAEWQWHIAIQVRAETGPEELGPEGTWHRWENRGNALIFLTG